jgi:hypothetical protein
MPLGSSLRLQWALEEAMLQHVAGSKDFTMHGACVLLGRDRLSLPSSHGVWMDASRSLHSVHAPLSIGQY